MRPSHIRILIFLLLLLAFATWVIPTAANFIIEYNWWKEVAQVDTWVSMLWYSIAPAAVGAHHDAVSHRTSFTHGYSPVRSMKIKPLAPASDIEVRVKLCSITTYDRVITAVDVPIESRG